MNSSTGGRRLRNPFGLEENLLDGVIPNTLASLINIVLSNSDDFSYDGGPGLNIGKSIRSLRRSLRRALADTNDTTIPIMVVDEDQAYFGGKRHNQ